MKLYALVFLWSEEGQGWGTETLGVYSSEAIAKDALKRAVFSDNWTQSDQNYFEVQEHLLDEDWESLEKNTWPY